MKDKCSLKTGEAVKGNKLIINSENNDFVDSNNLQNVND